MIVTYDGSVSADNRALIQRAMDDSLFPFALLTTQRWDIQVADTPGHAGKLEALTSFDILGDATTQFAPGLFEPGSALYVDVPFILETVMHEAGHVVTLVGNERNGPDFCAMFGIDFLTQWDPPGAGLGGKAWYNSGREAVAETFKDLYSVPANRHFLNRTNFQLPLWAWWYFIGELVWGFVPSTHFALPPDEAGGIQQLPPWPYATLGGAVSSLTSGAAVSGVA